MKLLFCESCHDLFRLTQRHRQCECENTWGWYEKDGIHATYGGDYAVPLGFANSSFETALDSQPEEGVGVRFEAFVVPRKCDTFIRKKEGDKNAPRSKNQESFKRSFGPKFVTEKVDGIHVDYYLDCKFCQRERKKGNSFFPRHVPMVTCESGGKAHCTCDTCFTVFLLIGLLYSYTYLSGLWGILT